VRETLVFHHDLCCDSAHVAGIADQHDLFVAVIVERSVDDERFEEVVKLAVPRPVDASSGKGGRRSQVKENHLVRG